MRRWRLSEPVRRSHKDSDNKAHTDAEEQAHKHQPHADQNQVRE